MLFILSVLAVSYNLILPSRQEEQQFSFLANSFIHGKLYFINYLNNSYPTYDSVLWQNNFYWPLGPGSAFVLSPFVYIFSLFNKFFYQGYLNIIIVLTTCFLIFKISYKLKYQIIDSLYLIAAFCFASMFFGVIICSWSWYFSHSLTVLFLFLVIWEYLNKKRYWLIGSLLGLVFLTRVTASLGIIFFILEIIWNKGQTKIKIVNLIKLLSPFLIFLLIQLVYNYFRFGAFLEQGYTWQILKNLELQKARDYGLFSLIHLPGNIYYSLINLPTPIFKDGLTHVLSFPYLKADPWGMSIFVTSPWLLYLFGLKYNDKLSKILIITIISIVLPIFLYYGIGFKQFGYRYALDFMPWLFFLFIKNYHNQNTYLSNKIKLLILGSTILNFYLVLSVLI